MNRFLRHGGRLLILFALLFTLCSVSVRANAERAPPSPAAEGRLEIQTIDAHEGIPLMGAGFRLYDSEGEPLLEGYTDAFGKLSVSNLPCGDYSVRQFKAPKGYELDETETLFSITEESESICKTFKNQRRPGTIQVRKLNPDGSPCEGAAFLLEFSIDKGKHWKPVFSRLLGKVSLTKGGCASPGLENGVLLTNDRGILRFTGLRADSLILYRVTELPTASRPGGVLYVGTLPIESENIYANDAEVFDRKAFVYSLYLAASDGPVYRLPEAGGNGFSFLSLGALLAAALFTITTKKLT